MGRCCLVVRTVVIAFRDLDRGSSSDMTVGVCGDKTCRDEMSHSAG